MADATLRQILLVAVLRNITGFKTVGFFLSDVVALLFSPRSVRI